MYFFRSLLSSRSRAYCNLKILSGPELEGGALRGAAGLVRAVCAVWRAVTHGEVGHAAQVRGAAELGPATSHKLQSLNIFLSVKQDPLNIVQVFKNFADSSKCHV